MLHFTILNNMKVLSQLPHHAPIFLIHKHDLTLGGAGAGTTPHIALAGLESRRVVGREGLIVETL